MNLEKRVAELTAPRNVGRIPLKISSSFSGFTADQWRNWIIIFSPVALKDVIPADHLSCWLLFVKACYLICAHILTTPVIEQIDQCLQQFCVQFQQLYGNEACTPNMHLHLHLKECLKSYGPIHGFWCFSFERINGVLGKYSTNNQSIEGQLMKKFLREQKVRMLDPPPEVNYLFDSINDTAVGSLCESNHEYDEKILKLKALAEFANLQSEYSITSTQIRLLPPLYEGTLMAHEIQKLQMIYEYIYPGITFSHFSHFIRHQKNVF